ncbi:MAG: hypothetical protein R3A52_13350 [Polyangiales bacterium]
MPSDADCAADAGDAGRAFTDAHRCVACRGDLDRGGGTRCSDGARVPGCATTANCASGETCCDGACVNTDVSEAHCGRAGARARSPRRRPSAARLLRGGPCDPGEDRGCVASNGCETAVDTPMNCGACGGACPVPPHADATCALGACGFTCRAGFADCDGAAANGCEADLSRDPAHCGACGASCSLPGAAAMCASGRCAVATCLAGFADCDGVAANGCEVETRVDGLNCGACGLRCVAPTNGNAACVSGACQTGCLAGFADCDGVASNGCERDLRGDASSCGACGVVCAPPRGVGACASGACAVARCDAGFADCDGLASNGCEAQTTNDPANCGACGQRCGASELCAAGACAPACAGALTLCAGRCVDVASDDANCGACGRACGVDEACQSGACALVCRVAGQSACAGRCVDTSSDATNCGACGRVCATGANASARCASGACGLACAAGFADCDGVASTGCEANTATSLAHCGACGRACAPARGVGACSGGRCDVVTCDAGYGDCDGDASNGCEADLRSDAARCGACGNACGAGEVCASGACGFPAGTTVIDAAMSVNNTRAAARATAGSVTVAISDSFGAFNAGRRVLLHQSRSAGADQGRWEVRRVVSASATSLTLDAPLTNTYTTAGTSRAQVVEVAEYDRLVVNTAGTLTAPDWDGSSGGVLAIDVAGDLDVRGTITMNGRGYRGWRYDCARDGRYSCMPGVQGESSLGTGAASVSANGGGGGGARARTAALAVAAAGPSAPRAAPATATTNPASPPARPSASGGAGASMGTLRSSPRSSAAQAARAGATKTARARAAATTAGRDPRARRRPPRRDRHRERRRRAGPRRRHHDAARDLRRLWLRHGRRRRRREGARCASTWYGPASVGAARVHALGAAGGFCSCARLVSSGRTRPGGRGGDGRVAVRSAATTGATSPAYDPR